MARASTEKSSQDDLPDFSAILRRTCRVVAVIAGATLITVALLWYLALAVHAAPVLQVIEIRPEDVSTPQPTPVMSLLPTPTPDPTMRQPVTSTISKQQMTPGSRKIAETPYIVRPNDTLWTAALEIGLDLDDMPCAVRHDFRADEPLIIGDALIVPDMGVTCHTIQDGETLASIAHDYNLPPEIIHSLAWNGVAAIPLDDVVLTPGNHLQIPLASESVGDAEGFLAYMLEQPVGVSPFVAYPVGGPGPAPNAVPVPDDWPFGSGNFAWPVSGWLSQGYRNDHRAIDIAAAEGSFVTSADRGIVIRSGWNYQGYGLFVIIDHNIDYMTLYSHLNEVFVEEGEIVSAGQVIGSVGTTGNSSGPHLHFEIRDFGRRTNPLDLLVR